MFRFVRTLAFATAGIGAVAGPANLIVAASAQTVEAAEPEKSRKSTNVKTARRSSKGKAAGGEDKSAPVDAEATLDKARRALSDGKAESAFDLADSVVKNAKKDPRNTARALAVRGEALVRLGRPAEAYADLQSALWVKGGLAGAEREAAISARSQAGQQAGLAPTQRASEGGRAQAERSGGPASSPATETQSSGFGGFFSSLFGGGGSKSQPVESRSPVTTAATAPRSPAVSSSEPQRIEQPVRKVAKPHATAPARVATAVATDIPSAGRDAGSYRIQLAAVRSRREAEDMARAVRKAQAAVLGSRNYEIIEEVYGNMGRFYRVRIGLFDHPTEAMAICATLRQSKVDCMMIDK